MKALRQPVIQLAIPAALGLIAIAVAVAVDARAMAILFGWAAIIATSAAAWRVAGANADVASLDTHAAARVAMDRRNPTFDGDTGLLAEWYFRLRVDEELQRAQRYQHPLTMLIVAPGDAKGHESARMAARLYLRKVDFASDLGGRIAVCLPETARAGAGNVVARLRDLVHGATVRLREFPADGETLSVLLDENAWRTRPPAEDETAA